MISHNRPETILDYGENDFLILHAVLANLSWQLIDYPDQLGGYACYDNDYFINNLIIHCRLASCASLKPMRHYNIYFIIEASDSAEVFFTDLPSSGLIESLQSSQIGN